MTFTKNNSIDTEYSWIYSFSGRGGDLVKKTFGT